MLLFKVYPFGSGFLTTSSQIQLRRGRPDFGAEAAKIISDYNLEAHADIAPMQREASQSGKLNTRYTLALACKAAVCAAGQQHKQHFCAGPVMSCMECARITDRQVWQSGSYTAILYVTLSGPLASCMHVFDALPASHHVSTAFRQHESSFQKHALVSPAAVALACVYA